MIESFRRALRSRLPALLLAALAGGGCSRGAQVDSTWLEGVPPGQSFGNFLVVGFTSDFNVRCRFERAMAATLRGEGVKATASCAEMSMDDPLTKDSLLPVVARLGADAVLVTELVDRRLGVEQGGTAEARGEAYWKATGYGWAYDYHHPGAFGVPVTFVDLAVEEPAFTLLRTTTVASFVYETREAKRLFAIRTTAKNAETREAVLDEVTMGVVERLKRDGLLRR